MRVLMLTQFYPPLLGGEELLVQNLSVELVARGHDVAVVTMAVGGSRTFDVDRGVRIYRLRGGPQRVPWLYKDDQRQLMPPWPDPELGWGLRQVLARERPDVVHAHNWLVHSFLPLKGWSRAPLVLSLHDYSLSCPIKTFMRRGIPCSGPGLGKCLDCGSEYYGALKGIPTVLGHRVMRSVERDAVDLFLPISTAVAEASGLVNHGLPFQVMPEFISDDVTTPRGEIESWLARLPREDYFLFVGGFRRVKGIEVLLRAYADLRDPPPLVVIGYTCAEPGGPISFPPNVLVLKNWPNDAVLGAWRRSIAALVPSLWPEPFGIVALEAMAFGRPVIASNTGGLADIVVDGETGVLVPPGDSDSLRRAMERLMVDPALRKRLGQAGRERVREFQAASVVPRFERAYAEVLGHNPDGRAARRWSGMASTQP